jgi:hypothetical protein
MSVLLFERCEWGLQGCLIVLEFALAGRAVRGHV